MDGTVGVVSELTTGSTFWLEIPLRPALDEPAEERGNIRGRAWTPPPAGTRLLLAEDDPVNQLVTSEMLRRLGFEVDVADNGAEAVERVCAGEYALVLMDLHMPVFDGIEATRRIRELPGLRSLPILAMTASVFEDDRQRCREAGMNGHIAKPLDLVQMKAELLRWLPPWSENSGA